MTKLLSSLLTTGATPIAVQDEGVQVTAAPSAINFTGDGVTATQLAGVVTVDIPSIDTTPIHVGTTAPTSPSVGDLWVDTN